MRNSAVSLLLICVVICYSCKNQSSGEAEDPGASALEGLFVRPEGDTLKITKGEVIFIEDIDFDLTAQTEEAWATVFNSAQLLEATEDLETYNFYDTITNELPPTILIFTYSYADDNWSVDDRGFKNRKDTLTKVDFSGVFKRVEQ